MALILAGVNHLTAPIEIRERLTYRSAEMPSLVGSLRAVTGATEGFMLSTCNRTEVYLLECDREAVDAVWTAFSDRLGDDARPFGYTRSDKPAVTHLFRVAAGLDSMILGEAQVQGQVRDTLECCRDQYGPVLQKLLYSALSTGSRVRNETGIGRGAASVSSAAVQLAKKIFGSLNGRRAMILGAGDVAELALECLTSEGVRVAIVANRTFERAQALASMHGAAAVHYDECWANLADVDLLICSTASPQAVVDVVHVQPAVANRGDRPLCILDLALPRDVMPAVGEVENVFLYDLDSLHAAALAAVDRRREDIPAANEIVENEVDRYWRWVTGLASAPVVTSFRTRMDVLRRRELAAAQKHFGALTPEQNEAVELFSRALMNKFLHEPSVRLRAAAANGRGLGVIDAARYLFGIDEPTPVESSSTDSPE